MRGSPGLSAIAIGGPHQIKRPIAMPSKHRRAGFGEGQVAGFDGSGSVNTSSAVTGFGGHTPGRPPRLAHWATGRFQVSAHRFSADTRGLFDAPQRPTEAPQKQNLLLCVVIQDVTHAGVGTCIPRRRQRLGRYACGGRFSGVHQWPVLGVHRGLYGNPTNRPAIATLDHSESETTATSLARTGLMRVSAPWPLGAGPQT